MAEKQRGLKLDPHLMQTISDIAQLTGESVKGFVSAAAEKEIQARKDADPDLQLTLEGMTRYRDRKPTSQAA